MTEIEKCELTLKNLENIRTHLLQDQTELADERGRVALGAHTGDKKSRSRLDEINIAAAKFASEFTSIEAAIKEANARLAAAQAAEASSADKAKAEQIAALNAQLREQLHDAEDAGADFISSVLTARSILQQMHALGVTSPTDQMFKINSIIAIKTVIQNLPQNWISDFEFQRLAPSQKKEFKQLAEAWGLTIENQIAARLGENKERAA
jgi:small-conductance mechanosensitive channel